MRFTRQDGVEEQWRIMQPLLDAPPPVHPVRAGLVGAGGGRQARRRPRPLARALGDVMTTAEPAAEPRPRARRRLRRSRRSPSTRSSPNCHTGALVAPDGAIDWLCVPRFDSPSIFGSLLDRQAGFFRFAPFGINHPTSVVYEPGTNVLETTWKTPNGWIVVRDALTMGPRDHEDTITPHTRPPADDDADHLLVRTVECLEGSVEVELVCEPAFDYGRAPATWTLVGRRPSRRRCHAAPGRRFACRPTSRWASRRTALVPARSRTPDDRAYCALSWDEGLRRRPGRRRGRGAGSTRRRASGGPGSAGPASRTTASATRSSARR